MRNLNDIKLIKACQKGEKNAFEELIKLYYPYVKGYLLKNTQDELLTEDLIQETFLKVIEKIECFDINKKISFGTYIISIAKNTYIDYCKKEKHTFVCIDNIPIPDNTHLEDNIINKFDIIKLEKSLRKIPPEQAQAIRLKFFEYKSLNEIAEIQNTKAITIKSRIHDGKVKLKSLMQKDGVDNE